MAEPSTDIKTSFWKKPFALWVIFGGLFYLGIAFIGLMVAFQFFDPIIVLFVVVFLVTGFLSLAGYRVAIAVGSVMSIIFIATFSTIIAATLANPASPVFWVVISGVPASILIVFFGIFSLVKWKRGLAQTTYLASPRSAGGLLTVSVVGFVIGGLIVGNLAGSSIARILGGAGTASDIRIVLNAAAPGTSEPFSPGTFTIQVGDTVTWYNADTMEHTATSDPGTPVSFDSPLLQPGDTFTFTFTQPGTYPYHCTPHPMMKGTIIVNP